MRRVAVEHSGGDQLGDGALAAVGGLDVIDERATGSAEVQPVHRRGIVGFGADVKGDHQPGLGDGRPHRLPHVVLPVVHPETWRHREVGGREPDVGGAVDLGDGVLGVEQRDRRRAARSGC